MRDLPGSVAFYESLGWHVANDWREQDVAFFQCGGIVVALWDRDELARDAGLTSVPAPGAVSIAFNARTREEVDAVLVEARTAGAPVVRDGAETTGAGTPAPSMTPMAIPGRSRGIRRGRSRPTVPWTWHRVSSRHEPLFWILLLVVLVALFGGVVFAVGWWLLWTALIGLVVGALARLLVRDSGGFGTGGTILAGVAGSYVGGWIAQALDLGWLLQVVVAVLVAAVVVAVASSSGSRAPATAEQCGDEDDDGRSGQLRPSVESRL